jgi:signal transduction histidine kinase
MIGLTIIVTLINILPLLTNIDGYDYDSTGLRSMLRSDNFACLYFVSVALIAPLCLDMALVPIHRDNYHIWERLILFLACYGPISVVYFSRFTPAPETVFAAMFGEQTICITAALLTGLVQSECTLWSKRRVGFGFFFFSCSQLYVYIPRVSKYPVGPIINVCFGISCLLYLVGLIIHIRIIFAGRRLPVSSEQYPLFCGIILLVYHALIVLAFLYWDVHDIRYVDFRFMTFVQMINASLMVIVTVLPGRIAQMKVRETEASLEMKKCFVRFLGHELRTPLNICSIGLELLCDAEQADVLSTSDSIQDTKGILREVHKGVVDATSILNDVLLYDNLETRMVTLQTSAFAVHDLLLSSLNVYVGQASAKGLRIDVDCELDLPDLVCDKNKFRQIIGKLVGNALRFSFVGDVVKVIARRDDVNWLLIQVVDSGTGMTEKHLESLFVGARFDARISQTGVGCGMGLGIIKCLVELHHGTILVESGGTGKGCSFTVRFPFDCREVEPTVSTVEYIKLLLRRIVVKSREKRKSTVVPQSALNEVDLESNACRVVECGDDEHTVQARGNSFPTIGSVRTPNAQSEEVDDAFTLTSSRRLQHLAIEPLYAVGEGTSSFPAGGRRWLEGKSALVVDDSDTSVKMVCRMLSRAGCTCYSAPDGAKAVSFFVSDSSPSVDFVIMDNFMPLMNGTDACRAIRRAGVLVPVIGLTGHCLSEEVSQFLTAGANIVLIKPLNINDLKSFLEE